jgi:hypothetical protein
MIKREGRGRGERERIGKSNMEKMIQIVFYFITE